MGDVGCFACGPNNPVGLRLRFEMNGDRCTTVFTPEEVHQSFSGILHGGLIAAILDEVMGQHLQILGFRAYTGRLSVRFRKPINVGQTVRFTSRVIKRRQRLFQMQAWAELVGGEVAAEATAEMMLQNGAG
ncbi:MAG: PaaI family thioesterase [Moorellales bacterium]